MVCPFASTVTGIVARTRVRQARVGKVRTKARLWYARARRPDPMQNDLFDPETTAALERVLRIFAPLFGAVVGSFLNVVIARVPEGLSVVHPPSRCPRCLTPIRWYDNVPVVSWILLRGRCRQCGNPISIRYPIIELLMAVLALAIVQRWGFDWRSLVFFVFAALLVAITYIDVDHWIIPHALTWPGIVLGIASAGLTPERTFVDALVGAVGGFAGFALVAWGAAKIFRKEALGQGDWWLLAMIGAFLGWTALLPVITLASLQGAVVGLLLVALGRAEPGEDVDEQATTAPTPTSEGTASSDETRGEASEEGGAPGTTPGEEEGEDDWVPPKNAVPFGPFLALAALEQLFFGDQIVELYERILVGLIS